MVTFVIAVVKALLADGELVSLLKGAFVALAGAGLTYALAYLQALPQTGAVPLIVAALSVLANLVRKAVSKAVAVARGA